LCLHANSAFDIRADEVTIGTTNLYPLTITAKETIVMGANESITIDSNTQLNLNGPEIRLEHSLYKPADTIVIHGAEIFLSCTTLKWANYTLSVD
jgi:hypothetical protein